MEYDVAIIGGGPAGSTVGSILKKYGPGLKVLILERETFPREHVGESQLPPITQVLEEMGCWDKVEAAGFPIKTGAMYRWGNTDDLWRFDFLIGQEFEDKPRPSQLEGQRYQTTFHVERSVFDEILLDHAAELGCEVCEGTKAARIECADNHVRRIKVEGTKLPAGADSDGWITARYYVDASGHGGVLRRALGVAVEEPTSLKNIAIWRYWRQPRWASMPGVGKGGIRIRVFSLGSGWMWFIPVAPDRASVGFVTHAEHYKASGLTPAQLYEQAIGEEKNTAELLAGAVVEGDISTTKDWSFLAGEMAGPNWLLVGESAGFADPILSGGMSLAMVGGREAAYILAELVRDSKEATPEASIWLKGWYGELQAKRIRQHIKFADYWYSANAHFQELKQYTTQIAAEAGLDLNPDEAFRWLAAGGFVSDDLTFPVVGTYRLGAVKSVMKVLTGEDTEWEINRYNEFKMNLEGAETVFVPLCREGRIEKVKCYRRGASLLPMTGMYRLVFRALNRASDAVLLVRELKSLIASSEAFTEPFNAFLGALEALEGMLAEGWVMATTCEGRPHLNVTLDEASVSLAS